METFLKTVLALACLVALVPLIVWAGSGSWRHAAHATKEYLRSMGWLVIPAVVVALAISAAEYIN